jgi:type I restriction enzyme M protein
VIVTNSKETTQAEINGVLWRACDTFRGVVDPSEYKNYILVMLFLKYISDVWKDHYEEYSKQFKGEKTRIARKMANERFTLPEGASFDDLYEKRDEPNLGELINIALEHIEEAPANKAKLDGVFPQCGFQL